MLFVQKFLIDHSFADLIKEHGVYCSFSKSGHKWSLNYDMIEAKEDDPLSQECRGLILSCWNGQSLLPQAKEINGRLSYDHIIPGKTMVLSYSMRRFFNYGQGACADINWNDPKLAFLEKRDGSLCIIYWDRFSEQWCVATRSLSEADLLMDNGIYTFRTLFEKALQETVGLSFKDYTVKLDKEITYCFELTSPINQVVVKYLDYRITLIAARSNCYLFNPDGEDIHCSNELEIEELPTYGVPCVRAYSAMSINQLLDWVSTLNPLEHEGVVVRDSNFNRIKVKNANYVAYSKVRDSLGHSERNCMELILLGKDDDVASFLPEEIVQNLTQLKTKLNALIRHYDEIYQSVAKEATDRKSFALLIAKNKELWGAPFFQIYAQKCSDVRDFIEKNKKNGSYSDGFLDKLLNLTKSFSA